MSSTSDESQNGNGASTEGHTSSGEPAEDPTAASPPAPPDPATEVADLKRANVELHDRLLRTAADFENWKKRVKKEVDDAGLRSRETILRELLPVLDNLERALQHAAADDPLSVGVSMVVKQMLSTLEKFGVTRFSAVGQPFDPNMHEAIQQVETSEHPPGTVATEFASGYQSGGKLLRAAMVGVAKAPTAPQA